MTATTSAASLAGFDRRLPAAPGAAATACAAPAALAAVESSAALADAAASAAARATPAPPAAIVSAPPEEALALRRAENARLLFEAPLLGSEEPPRSPIVRSVAPVYETGAQVHHIPSRRSHSAWTEEEELRLVEGHNLYDNRWELIRRKCGLSHRLGTQLREKWRNLVKAGHVRETGSPQQRRGGA